MSLGRIVEFAVRRRGVVLAIWAAVFLFGVASVRDLSIDAVLRDGISIPRVVD